MMAEEKFSRDRYYTAVSDVSSRRGASEKPLGRQISKEEQKASRKFLVNKQNSPGANAKENPHTQASKSNQDS